MSFWIISTSIPFGDCAEIAAGLIPTNADLTQLTQAIKLLGRLPFDPRFAESSDRGAIFVREYADTPLAKQLVAVALAIDQATASLRSSESQQP